MKILYVTTIGITMGFFKSLIKELIDGGHTVDIATNENDSKVPDCYREWGCNVFQISTSRSPFSSGNIKAIKEIRRIAKNYDIVHCHTPLAGMGTRLACRPLRKSGLKVIYTAHGFHFYKGAPLKNWLVYYSVEWVCALWTDVLITINKEDFERAKKHMHARKVEYVPGVGIDTKKFSPNIVSEEEKNALRQELRIKTNEKVFLSVGELSKRKNHVVVLEALSKWHFSNYKYFIVGKGELKTYLEEKINEYDLKGRVFLLGYRNDVSALCSIADLFIFPSLQEGLPVALMEAIASKATVICSKIRGSEELVTEDNLFSATNSDEVKKLLEKYIAGGLQDSIDFNFDILKQFDLEKANKCIKKLYYEY